MRWFALNVIFVTFTAFVAISVVRSAIRLGELTDLKPRRVCVGEVIVLLDESRATLTTSTGREQDCALECEPTDPWVP